MAYINPNTYFDSFILWHFWYLRRSSLAQEYREQLQMQMCSQQQAREAEKEEERREFEAGMTAEKNFQDKIQEILSTHQVLPQSIHPMRRALPW